MVDEEKRTNEALDASKKYNTVVEEANDYIEHFDILETITNVGNDEVFTPRKTCDMMLDSLPEEVWHNPLYKWLNPATKNGIFEREIALRLDKGLENVITDKEERRKHILQNMIFSIGQTKFTSNVARRTLYYCSQANRKCDGLKAPDGHYVNGYSIGNGSWFDDEEGNVKTPCTDHEYEDQSGKKMPSTCAGEARKKYKCKYCGIAGDSKYNDANQREKYAYEFIHINHLVLDRHLQNRFFGGNRKMKFDIIIGNPPYQLNDGGGTGTSAIPIYQKFIQQAISLRPKYLTMIIPSKWFSGGKGLDDFRADMLKDKHIRQLVDFENFRDVFPTVDLAGGACYFLWDRDYNGDCLVVNATPTTQNKKVRPLNEFEFFVRSNQSVEIVKKIKKQNKVFLSDYISPRLPFGIPTTYEPKSEGVPCYFTQKLGLQYVSKKDVSDEYGYTDKYKLLIPKAPIAGQTDFTKPIMIYYEGNILIAKPGEVCSESWLVAFASDDKAEVEGFKKYLLTKTFRFLLLQTLVSQNTSRKNFCFIPMLPSFKENITDDYLKTLWNLTDDEWQLINKKIRNSGE